MGSQTSLWRIGGELIYIQLEKKKEKKNKCMADEQFHEANNNNPLSRCCCQTGIKETQSIETSRDLIKERSRATNRP